MLYHFICDKIIEEFSFERIGEMNSKPEKLKTILRKMFSLKEDTASHEEIRERLCRDKKERKRKYEFTFKLSVFVFYRLGVRLGA